MATGTMDDDALLCAICLGPYHDPKFLPCFHTFCSSCILDVASRHLPAAFPCPSCRRPTSLPAGGVKTLQTNFYITSAKPPPAANVTVGEFCQIHGPTKVLEFYCVKCNKALCLNCKLTLHERHPTEDISVVVTRKTKQLTKDARRLESAESDMLQQIKQIEAEQGMAAGKKAALKAVIQGRHAAAVAAADTWRDEALQSLESVHADIMRSTDPILKQKTQAVGELKRLRKSIDQAVSSGIVRDILAVAEETSTGGGNKQQVSKMALGIKLSRFRPVLTCQAGAQDWEKTLRGYLGSVVKMHYEGVQSGNTASEVLTIPGATADTEVYSLCPGDSGQLTVSYAWRGWQEVAPCEVVNPQSQLVAMLPSALGKVSLKYRSGGGVLTSVSPTPSLVSTYNKSQRESHFRLDNDLSGKAWVKWVVITGDHPLKTKETSEFMIRVGPHRAFDVDDSGKTVIVLEEAGYPHTDSGRQVRMYRKPSKDAAFTYTPPSLPFCPSDVAFCRHFLMIADEATDSIHLVDVLGLQPLRFMRYLAAGNPLLVQPTALNTDRADRVWVACRGGKVITISL